MREAISQRITRVFETLTLLLGRYPEKIDRNVVKYYRDAKMFIAVVFTIVPICKRSEIID